MMNNINLNIEYWKNWFGLFPNKLFKSSKKQFVLLNGDYNCFGVDYEGKYNLDQYYNFAWSSDVDSFISFENEETHIYKLSKGKNNYESYKINDIKGKLDAFYNYLGKDQLNKENKIVPYVISIYNQLRNYCDEQSGELPLKALLYLFAIISDGDNPDLNKWGLDNTGKYLFARNNALLSRFVDNFEQGLKNKGFKPELDLILRHCSSKLFQEAHYNALLLDNQQPSLFGDISSHVITNNKLIIDSAYFTPTYLIRSIVEESLRHFNDYNKEKIVIFDPACGSGEFLKESISQLRNNGYKKTIKVIGWDISESAIDLARFILNFEKHQWRNKNLEIEITKVSDSLILKWPDYADILFMNPPYKSWENMGSQQRDIVKDILKTKYENNPNLASAFLWKAIESSKKDTIIGSVLPSSIFNADSYMRLRNVISEIVTNKFIAKLGNYIFLNALVDASIYIAQKRKPEPDKEVLYLWSNNLRDAASNALRGLRKYHFSNEIISNVNYSIYPNIPNDNKDLWLPISYNDISLKKFLIKNMNLGILKNINSIFSVRQGVRTGLNNVFLVTKSFYQSLSKSEKSLFRPAVTNKAIRNGWLEVDKYIWFPYTQSNKISTETELKKLAPNFYKHVIPHKRILQERNEVLENKYKWWDLTRERNYNITKTPKLVSTEFGKSDSFAYDKNGNYVVERGHAWIPKNTLSEDLNYAYLAIFSSAFFDKLLTIYSKQILSGYYLGKKFVSEIPIPDLSINPNGNVIQKLAIFGKRLSTQKSINYSTLNECVKSLYSIF